MDTLTSALSTILAAFHQASGESISVALVFAGLIYFFWRIQKLDKLDFADMLTKDGRAVSLTKVLQLLGGVTATWVIVKLTINNTLSEAVLGLYLTYVGAIEGWSKFVAAKYNFNETSVRDAKKAE